MKTPGPSLRRAALLCLSISLLSACAKAAPSAGEAPMATTTMPALAAPDDGTSAPAVLAKLELRGGATERRVIRNAELSLEAESPAEAQRKATQIAEASGGFVVSSDVRQHGDGGSERTTINLVLRVPAGRFSAALEELRGVGRHVSREKVSGQDVTEEYLDLEARLRSQRALESQFLEIMKDAKTVKDALEVQRQLGEVRSEIERFEGRRRFLDDRASLSTITLTISDRAPVVAAGRFAFGESVRSAAGDALSVGAGIVSGAIRLVGVLLPVALLIGLPIYLLLGVVRRRRRAIKALLQRTVSSACRAGISAKNGRNRGRFLVCNQEIAVRVWYGSEACESRYRPLVLRSATTRSPAVTTRSTRTGCRARRWRGRSRRCWGARPAISRGHRRWPSSPCSTRA
jgi:hypothetical protein